MNARVVPSVPHQRPHRTGRTRDPETPCREWGRGDGLEGEQGEKEGDGVEGEQGG